MMLAESKQLVCVRYVDHVLYNRTTAVAMKPQIRRAIGWLVYECEQYVILTWDYDDEAPTLHGGDSKASGLVLLKSDILDLHRLPNLELNLNCKPAKQKSEFAFRPSERKTQRAKSSKGEN
jgi:hypothetical protein